MPALPDGKRTAETAGVQTILGNGVRAFVTLCRAEKTTRTIAALHKKTSESADKTTGRQQQTAPNRKVRGRMIESHDGWRRVCRPAP